MSLVCNILQLIKSCRNIINLVKTALQVTYQVGRLPDERLEEESMTSESISRGLITCMCPSKVSKNVHRSGFVQPKSPWGTPAKEQKTDKLSTLGQYMSCMMAKRGPGSIGERVHKLGILSGSRVEQCIGSVQDHLGNQRYGQSEANVVNLVLGSPKSFPSPITGKFILV